MLIHRLTSFFPDGITLLFHILLTTGYHVHRILARLGSFQFDLLAANTNTLLVEFCEMENIFLVNALLPQGNVERCMCKC